MGNAASQSQSAEGGPTSRRPPAPGHVHGTGTGTPSSLPYSSHPHSHPAPSPSDGTSAAPATPPPGPPLPPIAHTFVDGGFLLPVSNVYPASPQDWLHPTVQRLILSRKLAPFYRGLEEWEDDWQAAQIRDVLRGSRSARVDAVKTLAAQETAEKEEAERVGAGRKAGKAKEGQGLDSPNRQAVAEAVSWPVREEETRRYVGETAECPLCFLYYPLNINLSRCCQQPICTECFVQVKRTDPTPQELKSEPVCCPFCVESNFGVTYEAPPLSNRTDYISPSSSPLNIPNASSVIVSNSPLASSSPFDSSTPTDASHLNQSSNPSAVGTPTTPLAFSEPRRKRKTTSHTSVDVVTTDAIQLDWKAKLDAIQAAVQRRANRRIIFRQDGERLIPVGVTSSRDPTGSAFLAALDAAHQRAGSSNAAGMLATAPSTESASETRSGRRGRRSRNQDSTSTPVPNGGAFGVDLEELMIMEAMRRSLLEEEERQKKEKADKEKLEKEAKRLEKEKAKEKGHKVTSSSSVSGAVGGLLGVGKGKGKEKEGGSRTATPTLGSSDVEIGKSTSLPLLASPDLSGSLSIPHEMTHSTPSPPVPPKSPNTVFEAPSPPPQSDKPILGFSDPTFALQANLDTQSQAPVSPPLPLLPHPPLDRMNSTSSSILTSDYPSRPGFGITQGDSLEDFSQYQRLLPSHSKHTTSPPLAPLVTSSSISTPIKRRFHDQGEDERTKPSMVVERNESLTSQVTESGGGDDDSIFGGGGNVIGMGAESMVDEDDEDGDRANVQSPISNKLMATQWHETSSRFGNATATTTDNNESDKLKQGSSSQSIPRRESSRNF